MAKNEIFSDANNLSLPVPSGTKSGDPVRLGGATGLNGVAQTDRADSTATPDVITGPAYGGGNPDGYASVKLNGAHEFVVAFAITNVLDPVYITSANALSGTASGNTFYGNALTTKAAPSGPLTVRIAN